MRQEAIQICYYELDRLRIDREHLRWFVVSLTARRQFRLNWVQTHELLEVFRRLKECKNQTEAAMLLESPQRSWLLREIKTGQPWWKR